MKIIPLNKLGEYCEGEDENTTLQVSFGGYIAIIVSGAGIAIATKDIWEKWGN